MGDVENNIIGLFCADGGLGGSEWKSIEMKLPRNSLQGFFFLFLFRDFSRIAQLPMSDHASCYFNSFR